MKYLCLIYEDEAAFGKMPKTEAGKMMTEYLVIHKLIAGAAAKSAPLAAPHDPLLATPS